MKLSVIIPVHGFDPNRDAAFRQLMKTIVAQDLMTNGEKDFEVLIVEQRTGERDHETEIPTFPYIRHIKLRDQAKGFNKSWCMNVGARQAKTKQLVFLDVDMIFGKCFFDKIRRHADEPGTRGGQHPGGEVPPVAELHDGVLHALPGLDSRLNTRAASCGVAKSIFFTVRGVAGEPLKVLLLYDRVAPEVATAAVALERLTFAVIGTAVAGVVSLVAITRLPMPGGWNTMFALLAVGALLVLLVLAYMTRRRSDYYLEHFVELLDRLTGKRLERVRVVRFILDVEHVLLDLIRGDRRRLLTLVALAVVCYGVMTLEVWLVFRAIGLPISITESLAIETVARLASVAFAFVPGNIGTLEASNVVMANVLELPGGGSLALARRIRALLWAGLGLALYPRVKATRA